MKWFLQRVLKTPTNRGDKILFWGRDWNGEGGYKLAWDPDPLCGKVYYKDAEEAEQVRGELIKHLHVDPEELEVQHE